MEQTRWNESNTDTMFYAGNQSYVNGVYNNNTTSSTYKYYFNICQQPVNLVSGYQRQHRKSVVVMPTEGSDPPTTDQYSRLLVDSFNRRGLHEQVSKACELSAVSGMVLVQPYLDFMHDDPAQGQLSLKIWEYNAFLVDPYFRSPDMSDANYFMCQEYITKNEAESKFGDKIDLIRGMSASPQRYGTFYFLPENANMSRSDMLILTYAWYKKREKVDKLYSRSMKQFFEISKLAEVDNILANIPDLEAVKIDTDVWKVAVVLNDQLMFVGKNPLGCDSMSPAIPFFWNYEPHNNNPSLRVRSLIRTMRDPQFLFNHKVIQNNDIAAATINSGWMRKIGAVANEDNLKKASQGYDIVINDGYMLEDCQKIQPTIVPQSDIELATQMQDLTFQTSGINLENWAAQEDSQASTLTTMLRMAANLMVFQKYFDQWDYSLKLVGELSLNIMLNNWNVHKVGLILGEQPTEYFYSKIFAKYKIVVEEGLLTPTQKNFQAQQMLDINQQFGREVFPPSMIIKDMNLQGKAEMMEFLEKQEQQTASMQEEVQNTQHAFEHAKLQEMMSKSANNLASAKERYGRYESNVGLLEERISEISKNRSLSSKAKAEAVMIMLDAAAKYGELETAFKTQKVEDMDYHQMQVEDTEKNNAYKDSNANEFMNKLMNPQVA